ncbi:MAG: hypothetical protein EBV05_14405 [Cyanobacteria bacterium WB6_1B_304]|nr:hypothetical protein [Cyanobacteria bacterium WB6_1B_304]
MVVRDGMGVGHPPFTIQAFQSNIVVKDVETILSRDVRLGACCFPQRMDAGYSPQVPIQIK